MVTTYSKYENGKFLPHIPSPSFLWNPPDPPIDVSSRDTPGSGETGGEFWLSPSIPDPQEGERNMLGQKHLKGRIRW